MKHLIFGSNSPSPKRGIFKQVFFLLFMATAAVITPCDAQTETDYELEVAGVKVTSKNCSDLSVIEGVSGRVGYDPYENYLFLYDAKIESKNGVPVVLAKKDVEIFVVGNCTLSAENAPCIVYEKGGSLYSTPSEGTLKCYAPEDYAAVLFAEKLNINGTELEATGKYGVAGSGDSAALGIVRGGLKAYGKQSATHNIASFEKEGVKFMSPEGFYFDAELRGMAKDGKLVSDTLLISPAKRYKITLLKDGYGNTNEEEYYVDEVNCNDLSVYDFVEGKMDYNPDTKTLTLDNVKINGGIIIGEDSLTILLKGTNEIVNTLTSGRYDFGLGYLFVDTASIRGVNGGELKVTSQGSSGTIFITNSKSRKFSRFTIKDCNMEVNGMYDIVNGAAGSSRPKDFDAGSFFALPDMVEKKTVRSMENEGVAVSIDNSNVKLNCTDNGSPIIVMAGGIELLKCRIISPENATIGKNYIMGADGNPLSESVVIGSESTPVEIDNVKNNSVPGMSKGVFTIDGIRMDVDEKDLPAGLYIIDGKKIIKK